MTVVLTLLLPAVAVAVAGVMALAVRRLRARTHELEHLLTNVTVKLEQLQRHFGRFAPDDVIEHLTEPGGQLAPSRRRVTVLFADLVGFTSLCDRLDPVETVSLLNGYFGCMSEVIVAHHGRITELPGDGMLALFGALTANPWQAQDAVQSALDMRAALAGYNAQLAAQGRPELRFGVGIHQGEVLAGVMGNAQLSKFGVVGDTINVASRVEGLTRVHQVDILITDEVRGVLDNRFRLRAMPAAAVKGKAEPIVTYHVVGLEA